MNGRGAILFLVSGLAVFGLDANATTLRPLSFRQMVERSGLVVRGTVTRVETVGTAGSAGWTDGRKTTAAPMAPASLPLAGDARPEPVLATEGGRMLFTQVTLTIEESADADYPSSITFRLPGGSDGVVRVRVFGVPVLEVGRSYLLFLEPGFETSPLPIVGVNQGLFEIAQLGDARQDVLLTADGDIVAGVEAGRLILRRNPNVSPGERHLAPPPVPDDGLPMATAKTTQAVSDYRSDDRTAMTVEAFFGAVRALRGDQP